jgi:molybdopterin converting factor small subunit
MRARVLFFGMLRELAGRSAEDAEFPEGTDLRGVFEYYAAQHPRLRAFRPDLPACVESIVDRALVKNPDARYETGAQMAAALGLPLFVPPIALSTDNAAMIGAAGFVAYRKGRRAGWDLNAEPNLPIF